MVCAKNYAFTSSEKKYLSELEMIDNIGNLMSKNDRVLDSTELSTLKTFIDEQIFVFTKKLLQMNEKIEIHITQSWVNSSSPGQFHPKHKHPNSVISGVMFVDKNDDESLPPIRFHRTLEMFPLDFEYENLNESNAGCRSFETAQGSLILFPSHLEHDVEKNESDKVRTSISFNTYVRGTVGSKEKLTEVTIP
jgi:uncharacterized protein (TIGR02466 family)